MTYLKNLEGIDALAEQLIAEGFDKHAVRGIIATGHVQDTPGSRINLDGAARWIRMTLDPSRLDRQLEPTHAPIDPAAKTPAEKAAAKEKRRARREGDDE